MSPFSARRLCRALFLSSLASAVMLICVTNDAADPTKKPAQQIQIANRPVIASKAENWPGWRGPRGDGSSLENDVPIHWSNKDNAMENIEWKVPVPGLGHASPIVWDDRIFVVSCLLDEADRVLCCYDRVSGKLLWQESVLKSPLEKKHTLNSFASSTPATDGNTVYVSF